MPREDSATAKVVRLQTIAGSPDRGFRVIVEIAHEGQQAFFQGTGEFPPIDTLLKPYSTWRQSYYSLGSSTWDWNSRILIGDQITNVSSSQDVFEAGIAFENAFQAWLEHRGVVNILDQIVDHISLHESVRVILKTDSRDLQRLPWHLWKLFERRSLAEFVLAAPYMQTAAEPLRSPLRILAVLGLCNQLNVTQDWQSLRAQLPDATIETLKNPTLAQLTTTLWEGPWDILFFAGHSASRKVGGEIYLGDTAIPLERLQDALTGAVRRGLKLAIFNSCDGLGLAEDLAVAKVPNVIVMREPVPDDVAQDFLEYFLQAFGRGDSFHLAVRHARDRLKSHEETQRYPQATWLPVIFQTPSARPWHYAANSNQGWRTKLAAGAVAIALLAPGLGWGYNQFRANRFIADRVSSGEDWLIKDQASHTKQQGISTKEQGIKAFRRKRWPDAILKFEQARQDDPQDPETLIYLNNAQIAFQESPYVAVVASVPIGSNTNIAQEMLRGVAQAQDEWNRRVERELPGADSQAKSRSGLRFLKVAIANDDNDSDLTRKLANHFVKQSELLAVIGHNATNATMAGAPIYSQAGLVMITPTSFAEELRSTPNKYRYAFRLVPSMQSVSEHLSRYIQSQGHQRVAICVDKRSEDNTSFAEAFKETFKTDGGEIILNDTCNAATLDRAPEDYQPEQAMDELLESKAQAIVITPHIDRLDVALKLAKANRGRLPLYGSPSFYTQETLALEHKAQGMVLPSLWTPESVPGQAFPKAAEALWSGPVNWRTATSYDATQIIIQVVEQLERANPPQPISRKALYQVLSDEVNFFYQGVTGEIDFGGSKKSQRTVGLLRVEANPSNSAQFRFQPLEAPGILQNQGF